MTKPKTLPQLYFAYGSNLDRGQMARRCAGSSFMASASLAGYRLAFSGNGSKWGNGGTATIEAAPQTTVSPAVVPGALYRMTPADVEALNGYENYPRTYRHLHIEVTGADGATGEFLAALTYQKVEFSPNPPPIKYLHQIWRAYRDLGLDEGALLAAVEESLNGET